MKLIKKKIYQITTTGTTTGCSKTNNCFIITPDLTAVYYLKFCLISEAHDIGFFDVYTDNYDSISYFETNKDYIEETIIVTGSSGSRLNELRKYTISKTFTKQYIGDGNVLNDGVDYYSSIENQKIIYYLGGIRYVDIITKSTNNTGTTTNTIFSFTTIGLDNPNFIRRPIIKNPNKENIISYPEINSDVFITRQELSAFESNYRLEYVKNLSDLETYAGGKYFNIIKNT